MHKGFRFHFGVVAAVHLPSPLPAPQPRCTCCSIDCCCAAAFHPPLPTTTLHFIISSSLCFEPHAQSLSLGKITELKTNGSCCRIFLLLLQHSLGCRSPHQQTRFACPRRRRQAAVTRGVSGENNASACAHEDGGVVLCAAIAGLQAASGRTAAAPRSHAHAVFYKHASARHVCLRRDCMLPTGHRTWRHARNVQEDVALGRVGYQACDVGSREESAGAAAAARVLHFG
jgi:hypothetical protein